MQHDVEMSTNVIYRRVALLRIRERRSYIANSLTVSENQSPKLQTKVSSHRSHPAMKRTQPRYASSGSIALTDTGNDVQDAVKLPVTTVS